MMVRIGAPRELDPELYRGDPAGYKRDLGAYISPRDLTQLFRRGMETPNIDNEHGVPWQVVYGISGNTRAFWSLTNARRVLGYEPEDDSELKYADDVREILSGPRARGLAPIAGNCLLFLGYHLDDRRLVVPGGGKAALQSRAYLIRVVHALGVCAEGPRRPWRSGRPACCCPSARWRGGSGRSSGSSRRC